MTTYTFTTFNDPLGTGSTGIMLFGLPETGTIGLGISATTGTIVGTYIDSDEIPEGFSFDGTTYTTVTNPLAANGTAIWGVNDSGQMVGTLSDSNHNSSSFLDSGGQFTAIAYPSAVITYAMGLNDSGQVVGFYEAGGPTNNFVPAGFLYSNGNYTTINDPLGTTATIADAINNHGQIVGTYADSNNTPHGFLLSGGVYTTIDDPLGVNGTIVKGINALGEIVGGYLDSSDDLHGFLYANGTYTTIDYSGATQTLLTGITDSGKILGSYVDSNGDHGFIASPPNVTPPEPTILSIQNDYLAITRMSLSVTNATAELNAINVGTTTETQYVNSLLSQVVDTTIPVVAVEGSMYGAVGSSAVITNLVTNFLPGQLAYANQVGLDLQTFACLETALVFAFANESSSTAFANNFGPSNPAMPATTAGDAAFAAAATNAIFGSAQTANTAPAILGYVHFLEGFFTANGIVGVQNPTPDQIVIAARAGAWGEGIAIAEGNNLGPFPEQTTNFLEDAAHGTAIYSAPFSSQPIAAPFQGAASASVASTAGSIQVTGVAAQIDHPLM